MNFFINETNFCLQVRKSESPKFSFERQKGFFLSFAFDTKQFVFKVLEESFHCLLVRLQMGCSFASLISPSLHFTFIYTKGACQIHSISPISSSPRCKTKKSPKFSSKHKKFILCDHEKCSARSKKEAEKFSLSLAARKIVIIFFILVHCLPTDRKYNSADRTEIFSNFFRNFAFIIKMQCTTNSVFLYFVNFSRYPP